MTSLGKHAENVCLCLLSVFMLISVLIWQLDCLVFELLVHGLLVFWFWWFSIYLPDILRKKVNNAPLRAVCMPPLALTSAQHPNTCP